ncbi:MAG: hypothetical protein KC457_15200 [Myxococcales bacterium]|nr:hypothetical protein [Myxococcales bacterium]
MKLHQSTILVSALFALACVPPDQDEGDESGGPAELACASAGSVLGLPDEPLPVPALGDAGCEGTLVETAHLPATWTMSVDAVSDGRWQLVSPMEEQLIYATGGRMGFLGFGGQVAWEVDVPEDLNQHTLVTQQNGTVLLGLSKQGGDWLELVKYDPSDGQLIESVPLGEVGADGIGTLEMSGSTLYVAVRDEVDGPVLLTYDWQGAFESKIVLGIDSARTQAKAGAGGMFYGIDHSYVLDYDGQVRVDLGVLEGIEDLRQVGGGFEGNDLGTSLGERMNMRRIDWMGAERWAVQRNRAGLAGGVEALAVNGTAGTMMVGWEQVEGVAGSSFASQPLVLYVYDGELEWADRIAATGRAEAGLFGWINEAYVAGVVEVEVAGEVQVRSFIRRYDPLGSGYPE